jgi:hypothetical protein
MTQLKDIPEETIRNALMQVPTRFQWVPDIAEFLALCKSLLPSSSKLPWAHELSKGFYRKQINPQYERQIILGAEIIKRLLKIFPELNQEYENAKGKKVIPNCNYIASAMLVEIKKIGRNFFPDDAEENMLDKVSKWDNESYYDILEKFKLEKKL